MWYWICISDKPNAICFSSDTCYSTRIVAEVNRLLVQKSHPDEAVWIYESPNHVDRDYKEFRCPDCDNLMSQNELDRTWDWAGPHCNKCGCCGMTMFASVMEKTPVVNGRQAMEEGYKQATATYEAITNGLNSIVKSLKFW